MYTKDKRISGWARVLALVELKVGDYSVCYNARGNLCVEKGSNEAFEGCYSSYTLF